MTVDVDENEFGEVLLKAKDCLAKEPSLIELPSSRPIVFVGDTHGDIESTEEVFRRFLGTHLMVFLGDYVDRAPAEGSSTYNLMRVLKEKTQHPDDIVLLRGNHEFMELWRYGFQDSLGRRNLRALLPNICGALSELSYVARTENGILAVHGGIPNVDSLEQLRQIPKGLATYHEDIRACQATWSDNIREGTVGLTDDDWKANGNRGFYDDSALFYGKKYLDRKLTSLGARVLVRGHDYTAKGYSLEDKVLTIFTSRQYADEGSLEGVYVATLDPNQTITSAKDLEIVYL